MPHSFCTTVNKYFKQIKGTPMGIPLSVVIAEIVIQNIDEVVLSKLGNSFKFWFRYVDDRYYYMCTNN